MKFQFIGKNFSFEKECASNEDVAATITRLSRKLDIRGHEVNRKIIEVWRTGDKTRIFQSR